MKHPVVLMTSPLLCCVLALSGCVREYQVSESTAVVMNGQNAGQVTQTTTVTVIFKQSLFVVGVAADDVAHIPSTGFVVSSSAPSSQFSIDTSRSPYATLTATTDTGFTSSITVPLQLVGAAINPINAGDSVASYALTETSQFDVWAQTVAQNTQAGATIQATAYEPFLSAPTSGTYTVSSQSTNSVTAPSNVAAAQITIAAPPPSTCGVGHTKCYQQ